MLRKLRRRTRLWLLRRDAKKTRILLRRIDVAMARLGWPRWRRKQFWRDFHRDDAVVEDLFRLITG